MTIHLWFAQYSRVTAQVSNYYRQSGFAMICQQKLEVNGVSNRALGNGSIVPFKPNWLAKWHRHDLQLITDLSDSVPVYKRIPSTTRIYQDIQRIAVALCVQ